MAEKKPDVPKRAGAKTLLTLISPDPMAAIPVAETAKPSTRLAQPCCWPFGMPGKPSFHFCNATALPAKPYCPEHTEIATARVRYRREDAA